MFAGMVADDSARLQATLLAVNAGVRRTSVFLPDGTVVGAPASGGSSVELAALGRFAELGELDADAGWTAQRWRDALEPYYEIHDRIGFGPDARGPELFDLTEEADRWLVRQVLDDPAGDRDWAITAEVDLSASDEAGEAVVWVTAVTDGS